MVREYTAFRIHRDVLDRLRAYKPTDKYAKKSYESIILELLDKVEGKNGGGEVKEVVAQISHSKPAPKPKR